MTTGSYQGCGWTIPSSIVHRRLYSESHSTPAIILPSMYVYFNNLGHEILLGHTPFLQNILGWLYGSRSLYGSWWWNNREKCDLIPLVEPPNLDDIWSELPFNADIRHPSIESQVRSSSLMGRFHGGNFNSPSIPRFDLLCTYASIACKEHIAVQISFIEKAKTSRNKEPQ